MNRMLYILCAIFLAVPAVNALDLHTDAACAPLKITLETAQPVEKVQEAWDELCKSEIAKSESKALALQAIAYARDQKNSFDNPFALALNGSPALDTTHLKWGMVELMAAQSSLLGLFFYLSAKFQLIGKVSSLIKWVFIPDMMFLRYLLPPKTDPSLTKQTPAVKKLLNEAHTKLNTYVYPSIALIRAILGMYLMYKGINNSIAHRKLITEKRANLDAAIAYLETHLITVQ